MIAEFIHRADVQKFQEEAERKVKLLERVHQFNALIIYKLEQLSLCNKKKVTYKKKNYIQTGIQLGAKIAIVANGTCLTLLSVSHILEIIASYAQASVQIVGVISKASSFLSTIAPWLLGIGAIIFVASEIYAGIKWCELKEKIENQNQELDSKLAEEINYFNELAKEIEIEDQPIEQADVTTIAQKQMDLLKVL